jgi:purine-binding chemotaxis protein CheW
MTDHIDIHEEEDRYFIFQLGSELCGTPLLGVREVIQPQEIKPVPNTKHYFVGMINIRGQIIGVIDLRMRYGHPLLSSEHNAFVVFDTPKGTIAAIVDRVDSVTSIAQTAIDRSKSVITEISPEYHLGVAHVRNRLVTLLDLNTILAEEVIISKNLNKEARL